MLNPPALVAALASLQPLAMPMAALTFRSIHLRYFANFAAAQPLFAAPGGVAGSRFVRPNGPAALYTALDADTAHREGNQAFYQTANAAAGPALIRAGGLRPDPVVLIGVHLHVTRLLDLRAPAVLATLGIQSDVELVGPWRLVPNAATQILGDTVFNNGQFEGIIFPSAQNPGHHCVVLFPARLLAQSRVHFADPTTQLVDRLP